MLSTTEFVDVDPERLAYLNELQQQWFEEQIPPFDPLPHQQTPPGDWFMWLLEAGRGAGKTATASNFVADHLNGPPCISRKLPHRVALIAPTLGDAVESARDTDMALSRLHPEARLVQGAGGAMVRWPNGSQVRLFGTHTREDSERLRAGGNRCLVWAEELATWKRLKESWTQMLLGLRLGPNPRVIATTTPKARPDYVDIRKQATIVSHATTLDNPNLNERQKQLLVDIYGDTSIGQQEIYGELIEEAEGALWTRQLIEDGRIGVDEMPIQRLGRTLVGIDPPGGATEAGIVAAATIPNCPCGAPRQPHYAVLEDASGKLTPNGWARRSVDTLDEWDGDALVAEANFGGDMVESNLRNYDPNVRVLVMHASRGKRMRAEPIVGLYEQQRVHHIGAFPQLETEQTQWIPDESEWSPNRLDALVWVLAELSGRKVKPSMRGWTSDEGLKKPAP